MINKGATIKNNFIYSMVLTLSTYLVPLLVFPYISRIIGPQGIGAIESIDSLINYSIIFSMMGLTTLGVREISRNRDNKERLSKVFSTLFTLNVITTILILLLLIGTFFFIPNFSDRRDLFFLGISKIIFNLFCVEWFFKGLERFRYITIRSIVIRILFVILVFCFVNDKSDTSIYYALWVGMTMSNAICNWKYRKNFAQYRISDISLKVYIKPFFLLGVFAVFSSIYTQLNVYILKFFSDDFHVGYYATAIKIYGVLMALFLSMTSVMVPRISYLVEKGDMNSVRDLTYKMFKMLFMIFVPVLLFFEFFAHEFIIVFAGDAFLPSVIPMRIVMFQLLVIGTEQIFILQLLIPAKKDYQVAACSIVGACVCIISNFLLTSRFNTIGSSLSWLFAECSVLIFSSFYVKKFFNILFPYKMFMKHIAISIPYILFGICILYISDSIWERLLLGTITYLVWTIIIEEKIMKLGISSYVVGLLKSLKNNFRDRTYF